MKYLFTKIIQGKPYYYLDLRLTRSSNGKQNSISRYLDSKLPQDVREPYMAFFSDVGELVGKNTDSDGKSPFARDSIMRIEKTRFWYHSLHLEPFQADLGRFRRHFTVQFILNSNRAEGSQVVREDIERIMERKKVARSQIDLEITNSIEAMAFAFSKDMKWSGPGIKKVHQLLFKDLQPKIAGVYKKVNNIAGEGLDPLVSSTTPWQRVPGEVTALMKWFRNVKKTKIYPPWLAIELYWRFERIHPFEDGNGRVGRILLNAVLQANGFLPVVFDANKVKTQSTSIGKAIKGYSRPLANFLGEQTKWTIKTMDSYKEKAPDFNWKRRIPPWWRTKRANILYDDVGTLRAA